MSSTPQPYIPPATSSASLSGPSTISRRPTRQTKTTNSSSQGASISSANSTRAQSQNMSDSTPVTTGQPTTENGDKSEDPSKPEPWKHPDELPYIRREDWSQDLMVEYLCQKSFTIPPREGKADSFVEIYPRDGPSVTLPRKYRVPLMFLAKFQWESLRLVLNATNPATEWQEFKFDIIHITRLCQHLFQQAREAKLRGGERGLERTWRSAMFDRVLTRFYHHWFISREWSLRHFYEEFQEEEYENDILKMDWARWAIKGHKGFRLSRDEIQHGLTAEDLTRGLQRGANGWTWKTTGTEESVDGTSEPISPSPGATLDAITNVDPSHNTIEVKQERMDLASDLEATEEVEPTPNVTTSPPIPINGNPSSDSISTQLAGNKRPREDDESPAPAEATPRRRKLNARKSIADVYRYDNIPKMSQKLTEDAGAASGSSNGEGQTAPEKLSIKLKRNSTVALSPRKSTSSSNDQPSASQLESASAPIDRPPRKKRKRPSKAVAGTESESPSKARIIVRAPSPPAPETNGTASALSKPSPTAPGLLLSNSANLPFNKSQAAILIPTNPKQHMSFVPSGQDSAQNTNMDVTLDRASATLSPAPTGASLSNTQNETTLPIVPFSSAGTPIPISQSASVQQDLTRQSSAMWNPSVPENLRPMLFVNASESLIAHGLLDVVLPTSNSTQEIPTPEHNMVSMQASTSQIQSPPGLSSVSGIEQVAARTAALANLITERANIKKAAEKAAAERVAAEKAASDKAAAEKLAAEQDASDKAAAEKAAADKVAAEKAAADKVAAEKAVADKEAAERAAAEEAAAQKAAAEKAAAEKAAAEKAASEKAASEKAAAQKAAAEKAAAEKAASEKAAAQKAAAEKAAAEKAAKKAAAEKAATEKAAAKKAAADKAAMQKAAAEKAAADKAETERAAVEKVAAEKAATEKSTVGKARKNSTTGAKISPTPPRRKDGIMEVDRTVSTPVVRKSSPVAPTPSQTIPTADSIFPISATISTLMPRISPESTNGHANGLKDDKMVIDSDDHPTPSPSRDRSVTSEHSVGLLMAQDTRAKSLHTILLLRDLLEFLRVKTLAPNQTPHEERVIVDTRTRRMILDEEEELTVDQRLDVLAHASVALAKVLYPYRGVELERRIVSLDKRLQQQFDMVWTPEAQLSSAMRLQARISSDKEVQATSLSSSRGTQTAEREPTPVLVDSPVATTSQGIQAVEEVLRKELASAGTQTDEVSQTIPHGVERKGTPLSPDTTMIDLSSSEAMESIALETSKPSSSDIPRRSEPVAKIMMAIMRNMADLLECSTQEGFPSKVSKGKERESEAGQLTLRSSSDGYSDSPIVSTIVNEFRNMKEELRHTEQWNREELRVMSVHHRTEVESLKDEIQRGKEELARMKVRHQAEMEHLLAAISLDPKGKRKEDAMEGEAATSSSSELQELRRRISSLESRSGFALEPTSHGSPAPPTPSSELSAARPYQWQAHPLGHLMTQEYQGPSSPQPTKSFARENSSKPGTPLSADRPTFYTRSADGMEVEESLPLPAKSQRKLHMMMFPRAPLG